MDGCLDHYVIFNLIPSYSILLVLNSFPAVILPGDLSNPMDEQNKMSVDYPEKHTTF